MKKLSLSILAVMLSVCLLFALSVQCLAVGELTGNDGMGENIAGDINNGFIEGNPNNPNDGNDGSGFTSDGTNESGTANGSYNGGVNGDSANDNGVTSGVDNGTSESAAAQDEASAADGNTETSSGFSWVMLLVWLVIIAAVILLIIALLPKRRNV